MSSLNYPLSKEVKEIYLERTFLEGKPGELLKLVSRLDSLDSDGYKGKIEDKYPMLLEGRGVMKASYCNALTEDAKPFQAPGPTQVPFPLYQKTKEDLDRNGGGDRCHIQS